MIHPALNSTLKTELGLPGVPLNQYDHPLTAFLIYQGPAFSPSSNVILESPNIFPLTNEIYFTIKRIYLTINL